MSLHNPLDSTSFKSSRKPLLLAIGISLLMTIWVLSPGLWDRYRVVKDMQNLYWMARFQEPGLFQPDYLRAGNDVLSLEIFGSQILIYPFSIGYSLLLLGASFFFDPLWFSKALVFLLVPLCVVYLFRLGQQLRDTHVGLNLSLLSIFFMLAAYQSISLASGLQRSFTLPLFILFLYYLIRKNYLLSGLIVVMGTLFYIPIFPVMILTYGLSVIVIKYPFKISWQPSQPRMLALVATLFLSLIVVGIAWASINRFLTPATPPTAGPSTLENGPAVADLFLQNGFSDPALQNIGPLLGQMGIIDSGSDLVNVIVLLLLGLLIYATVGRQSLKNLPGVLWTLMLASLLSYILALFFIYGLSSQAFYWPSRHTRATLFLVPLFYVGLNWDLLLEKLPAWLRKRSQYIIFYLVAFGLSLLMAALLPATRPFVMPFLWVVAIIISGVGTPLLGSLLWQLLTQWWYDREIAKMLSIITLTLLTILLGTFYTQSLGMRTLKPSSHERNVYEFIRTLPPDILVAGQPDIMSGIPLFSQRRVLFRGLFPQTQAPIIPYFSAHYAEDPQAVLEFCQQYQVTHLVINIDEFNSDYLAEGAFFYQPWNEVIAALVVERTKFALPDTEAIFTSGPLRVVACHAETLSSTNS